MEAWVIRPYPHLKPRMQEFVHKRIIAVGWPNIGDLTGLDRQGIATRLKEAYPKCDGAAHLRGSTTLLRFRDGMQIGDVVIVAPRKSESANVSVAQILGPYHFDPETDGDHFGYPHHRRVDWLRRDVPRNELPGPVASSLNSQGTLFKTNCDALLAWARRAKILE